MTMKATTVFLRHIDKEKNVAVREHRVWDRDLFLETQLNDATKEKGSIEVLTEREYQKARK